MPHPPPVSALVDLRACAASSPPAPLTACARALGGTLTPWRSPDDLTAALRDTLRDGLRASPRALIVAGDDRSFSAFTRALLSPSARALHPDVTSLPVAFLHVGAGGGTARRVMGLPSGGLRAQIARLLHALSSLPDPSQPLATVATPTLRVADSDASAPLYGLWLGVGAHTWAAERALRLPAALQRPLLAPLRLAALLRAHHSGGPWAAHLDPSGLAAVTPKSNNSEHLHAESGSESVWVGAWCGVGGAGLRAARGVGWRGMAPEVLWAGRVGEQAPFWEHPSAVGLRCDTPPNHGSAYVLDGTLRFGSGQRVVEVTPGPLLSALPA